MSTSAQLMAQIQKEEKVSIDKDGDGVPDENDACPTIKGLPALDGCPDSDGDGIIDGEDKCPHLAGPADRGGCPIADMDGDGFYDIIDRCPELYSKTNRGCPETSREVMNKVSLAAKGLLFNTGKSKIRKTAYRSLNTIVAVLMKDETLRADIVGHTDNVGNDDYNMQLSKDRATAVRDYFITKGIAESRLTSEGFGETQPVATNETAAGRAQNRRTEIKLRNFAR